MKEYEMKCYAWDHPRILVTEKFVESNKLYLWRTQEETLSKMVQCSWFDMSSEVLVDYLEREYAKDFYSQEYIEKVERWEEKEHHAITDVYEATQDFLDYMVFWRTKALDERWLSASRTINKTSARMRLLGRDDVSDILNDSSKYNPYGMPALIWACEVLWIAVPDECKEFAGHPIRH